MASGTETARQGPGPVRARGYQSRSARELHSEAYQRG